MREILNGIFTWPWFSEPHGYNFNGHLIPPTRAVISASTLSEPNQEDLEDLALFRGRCRILLTNRNHSRAANKVRARTSTSTAICTQRMRHTRAKKEPN